MPLQRRFRPRPRTLIVAALAASVLLLSLRWLAQPSRVAALITQRVGAALGLEITASGASEYRLRGTPMLVLRDVVATEPGARTALLRTKRILIALPWSTLRSGGSELVAQRIQLDSPQIDLPALQRWLAARPPGKARLPTLTDGLRIRDGEIRNRDWRIDRFDADVPLLQPKRPLRGRLRGRYLDAPLSVPVDLAFALSQPQALIANQVTGFAAHGGIAVEYGRDWRMPATIALSGPLQLGEDDLRIAPARLGMAATLETSDRRVPFSLGLYGPLVFDEATLTLAPAGMAVRGRGSADEDPIPAVDAHGTLVLGSRMRLQLDGRIAQWPQAWPALPPPIGQSVSPLPFALRYDGAPALGDVATLDLQRDEARFTGHFRLPEVLGWIGPTNVASPLPPLAGTFRASELEISGARLQGVEIEFGDEDDTR